MTWMEVAPGNPHPLSSRSATKRHILRSVRISKELDEILQCDAAERSTTVSDLVNSILTKYAEWDRYSRRCGYIVISRQILESLLELVEEEKLTEMARRISDELSTENIVFWYRTLSMEAFLKSLLLHAKHADVSSVEIGKEGHIYSIAYRHELGKRWSLLMKYILGRAIKALTGSDPEFILGDRVVLFSFRGS